MPEHIYCICYLCELVCCKERVGKRKEGSERERERERNQASARKSS